MMIPHTFNKPQTARSSSPSLMGRPQMQPNMGFGPGRPMGQPQQNPYQLVQPMAMARDAGQARGIVQGRQAQPTSPPRANPTMPNAWSRIGFNPRTSQGMAPNLSSSYQGSGHSARGPAGVVAQGVSANDPYGAQELLNQSTNPTYDLSQMGPNMYANLMRSFYGFGSSYGG